MLRNIKLVPQTNFPCVLLNIRRVVSPLRRSSSGTWLKNAFIDQTAEVDKSTTIQPNVVIFNDVKVPKYYSSAQIIKVGSKCLIGAGTVIGSHVIIGNNTTIGFNVSLMNCIIGNNVYIKNGACIGQDGFGFLPDNIDQRIKVPQTKKVIIEDDVEIGANTCIDRGSKRDTIIKKGTKLDNLIQIAHNVELGTSTLICAQSGVAGSTVIGDSVTIGGQVGVFQHIQVGSRAKIGARSLVKHSLKGGIHYDGSPAKPLKELARSRKQQRIEDTEKQEEEGT